MTAPTIGIPLVGERPAEPLKGCAKTLCAHARAAGHFLYETPSYILATTASGVALQIIRPHIGAAPLVFAGATLLTRLTIKLIDKLKPDLLYSIRKKVHEIDSRLPMLKIVLIIAVVALSFFSLTAAIITASLLGIACGLISDAETNKENVTFHVRRSPLEPIFTGHL